LVAIERGKDGRDKIRGLGFGGKVASKVLCDLETFMKFPKGSFTASSLKWLPNQKKTGENFGLPDAGGCGP